MPLLSEGHRHTADVAGVAAIRTPYARGLSGHRRYTAPTGARCSSGSPGVRVTTWNPARRPLHAGRQPAGQDSILLKDSCRGRFWMTPWPRSCNDDRRLDWAREASCLSISWPNYATFAAFRRRRRDVQWAILTLDARVLWEMRLRVLLRERRKRSRKRYPVDERKRPIALRQLFEDLDGCPPREPATDSHAYPTRPQAEVLAFDVIAPDCLTGVLVSSRDQLERFATRAPSGPPSTSSTSCPVWMTIIGPG